MYNSRAIPRQKYAKKLSCQTLNEAVKKWFSGCTVPCMTEAIFCCHGGLFLEGIL
jgi:hypothetical protein